MAAQWELPEEPERKIIPREMPGGLEDSERGWVWKATRGNEGTTVAVQVTATAETAHADDRARVAPDAAEAIETRGRSAIEAFLGDDRIPRWITVKTGGVEPS